MEPPVYRRREIHEHVAESVSSSTIVEPSCTISMSKQLNESHSASFVVIAMMKRRSAAMRCPSECGTMPANGSCARSSERAGAGKAFPAIEPPPSSTKSGSPRAVLQRPVYGRRSTMASGRAREIGSCDGRGWALATQMHSGFNHPRTATGPGEVGQLGDLEKLRQDLRRASTCGSSSEVIGRRGSLAGIEGLNRADSSRMMSAGCNSDTGTPQLVLSKSKSRLHGPPRCTVKDLLCPVAPMATDPSQASSGEWHEAAYANPRAGYAKIGALVSNPGFSGAEVQALIRGSTSTYEAPPLAAASGSSQKVKSPRPAHVATGADILAPNEPSTLHMALGPERVYEMLPAEEAQALFSPRAARRLATAAAWDAKHGPRGPI
jgi:hypothetical protein